MTPKSMDAVTGAQVFFKCENLQRGGAFKFRGAYNRLARSRRPSAQRGVVALLVGQPRPGRGAGRARARHPATVVMPTDAPALKLAATGATAPRSCVYDRLTEDREAIARRLADERGLTLVPPYDHPLIMAGQGRPPSSSSRRFRHSIGCSARRRRRAALGLRRGGDGARCPNIKVLRRGDRDVQRLGAEPGGRPPDPHPAAHTIADGMRTQQPGALTFPIVRDWHRRARRG